MFNKRGAEMTVSTLILIVLGVLILVFLIVGFSIGWNKIFPFISPPNNVKDVADKCQYYCDVQSRYDYCVSKRDVKIESSIIKDGIVFGDKQGKFKATCNELASYLGQQLDIRECPSITCDSASLIYSSDKFAKLACNSVAEDKRAETKVKYYNDRGEVVPATSDGITCSDLLR